MKWETLSPSEGMQVIKFLPLLRKAVAAAPDRLVFKVQLARALFEAGQTAELVDLLEPLVSDEDAAAELLYWLGRAAIAKGDDPLALVALRSAAAEGAEDAFDLLAATLARLGREDEALNAGLEALKRNPRNPESLRSVAIALCNRCEIERLWNLCLDLRSRGAHGGLFSAVMASTAAMLGREDELGKLMDRSKWFLATPLAVPEGFNRGLAAEILADQSAHPMPETMVTHGAGARVDHLQRSESPHTQDLFRLIRAAVENYVAEREIHSSDPIIAHRPSAVALKSWSLAVHDDGHTSWHFHPSGWLSGVYYVEMPIIEPSGVGHPGAIEFGPYPFGRDTDPLKAHRWHLVPTPGLFLLFPSYYAHRTWPTGVVASRISVAFDVRPAPSGVDAEQSG